MKNLRGAAPKPENNDDCRSLAPYVMTLFDGEANETEARRARAHLLICQSCANRWLDWNRSRDLLRSAPVPAPPPQLLWRVLMACRLVGAPRRAASSLRDTAPLRDTASLRAALRPANSDAATSRATANPAEIVAPANFSAQILARTTRARAITNPSVATPNQPKNPLLRAAFPLRLAFSPLKMSALALPALAAWMMVLQRDVWPPAPISAPNSDSARAFAAPRRAANASAAVSATQIAPRAASAATPDAALSAKTAVLSPGAAKGAAFETPNSADDSGTPRPSRARVAAVTALSSAPVMRAIEASFGLRAGADFERAARPESRDEPQNAAGSGAEIEAAETRRMPRAMPRRAARVRLAALSNPKNAPRLRATRWQTAPLLSPDSADSGAPNNASPGRENDASARGSAPQLLRVSLPSARAPQPPRLLAENFDAADARVDEMRSVVDDFRATLGPDDAGTDPTPDNDDDLG